MIRRRHGDDLWLVRQADHAAVAAALARHVGNGDFARPEPFGEWAEAVARHDDGWVARDDLTPGDPAGGADVLNAAGGPRDFAESTPAVALAVWTRSADLAERAGDGVALLVGLHGLHLSADAVARASSGERRRGEAFDSADLPTRFAVNRFQHAEVERHERLRASLGLRVDRPLRLGLAERLPPGLDGAAGDPAEQDLLFRFFLLRATDGLSLAACCEVPPAAKVAPVYPRPGAPGTTLRVERPTPSLVRVSPWPFDVRRVEVEVPYRAIPARRYAGADDYRAALERAGRGRFGVTFQPG